MKMTQGLGWRLVQGELHGWQRAMEGGGVVYFVVGDWMWLWWDEKFVDEGGLASGHFHDGQWR